MKRFVWLVLAVSACSSDRFRLDVVIPDAYSDEASALRLEILEPDPANPFGCDALAYGLVDEETRVASRDSEVMLIEGDAALRRLDRERRRLFVATAETSTGDDLLVGCTAVTRLEDAAVTLELEPVVNAFLEDSADRMFDRADPTFALRLYDALGAPVADVPVEWVTAWRDENRVAGRGASDAAGRVQVRPERPDRPGPATVEVRVRWAGEVLRASGFVAPVPSIVPLPNARIEDALGTSFGAAVITEEAARLVFRMCRGVPLACDAQDLGAFADARLVEANGGVVVVTEDRWYRWRPNGPAESFAGAVGASVYAVAAAGPCDGGDESIVVLTYDEDADETGNGLFTASGARSTNTSILEGLVDLDFLAAGCADLADGRRARTLVVQDENEDPFVVSAIDGDRFYAGWAVQSAAIGVRGVGPLLGTQALLDDVVLSRPIFGLDDDDLFLEPDALDDVSSYVPSLAGAHLDGDDRLDVAAIVADYDAERDAFDYALFAVIDDALSDERIAGETSLADLALCSEQLARLFAVDLDEDGDDELVVVDDGTACGGGPVRVIGYGL